MNATKFTPMKHTIEIAENETGVRVLPGDKILVILSSVTASELAYIPGQVYTVTRDLCNGELTEGGRDALAMLLNLFSDLLPNEQQVINGLAYRVGGSLPDGEQ